MMDELKQQFYEVMHKYQKPFSEEGVTANLTQWYEQKQGLLQLEQRPKSLCIRLCANGRKVDLEKSPILIHLKKQKAGN